MPAEENADDQPKSPRAPNAFFSATPVFDSPASWKAEADFFVPWPDDETKYGRRSSDGGRSLDSLMTDEGPPLRCSVAYSSELSEVDASWNFDEHQQWMLGDGFAGLRFQMP